VFNKNNSSTNANKLKKIVFVSTNRCKKCEE